MPAVVYDDMPTFLDSDQISRLKVSEVFLIGEGEVTNELHALVLFRLLSFFNDTSLYEPIPAGKARSKIVVVLLAGGRGIFYLSIFSSIAYVLRLCWLT